MKHLLFLIVATLIALSCSPADSSKLEDLFIDTSAGTISYHVETAQTPEELQKGLMYRDVLSPDSGMIFKLEPPQQAVMWMKNTRIPLDMLFIDSQGRIVWIYENAAPGSEKYIISPVPSAAVLEINGGDIKKHGIKPGDKVRHRFLTQ